MIATTIDESQLALLVEALPEDSEILIRKLPGGEILVSRVLTSKVTEPIKDYWLCDSPKQAASTIMVSVFEAEKANTELPL